MDCNRLDTRIEWIVHNGTHIAESKCQMPHCFRNSLNSDTLLCIQPPNGILYGTVVNLECMYAMHSCVRQSFCWRSSLHSYARTSAYYLAHTRTTSINPNISLPRSAFFSQGPCFWRSAGNPFPLFDSAGSRSYLSKLLDLTSYKKLQLQIYIRRMLNVHTPPLAKHSIVRLFFQ